MKITRMTAAVLKLTLVVLTVQPASLRALTPEEGAVFARIVDVGAGQCCVIKIPGGHNIVYDTGNYEDRGATALAAIRQLIPPTESIDLLILSHSDSDHVAATKAVCDSYHVKRAVHAGINRNPATATWSNAKRAIQDEASNDNCEVMNLSEQSLSPGKSFNIGPAKATLVSGFALPPAEWGNLARSEQMNAGSIVLRVSYRGRAILLTGDAVGRHINDPDTSCIASEKFMVDNQRRVPINADVIVAPHHGADNGSSVAFINAVRPSAVIFSAGHKFQHPRKTAVERYLRAGVAPNLIFRTDRGDDEGAKEWAGQRVRGRTDPRGDDDVDVLIRNNGQLLIDYFAPPRRSSRNSTARRPNG